MSSSSQFGTATNPQPQQYHPDGSAKKPDGDAKESLVDFARNARAEVAGRVEPAVQSAKSLAEEQKSAGADKIKHVARAVDQAADHLERELPQAARTIRDAAARLEQVSAGLKDRSVDDLLGTFGSFARSQPVAFFGGAVLTGFILARFLKSSSA